MTQISVVIPAYNYAALLTRAVESVVNQPGEGFEVIIIDDGSTDQTESVAKSLVARFPHITSYTRQENVSAWRSRFSTLRLQRLN